MSKSAKTNGAEGVVPRLRFPEYATSGAWSVDLVEHLVKTITPPKKLPSTLYYPAGGFPIVDQSAQYICGWTDDATALVRSEFPLVVFGDHTCELKLIAGPFAQGADGIKILAAKKQIAAAFLYQYLLSSPVRMVSYRRHYAILKDKPVPHPDVDSGEQQKIAACLSSLDDLIAARADKLAALKQHKQGLLEQLFPREGETVPRLRFPEFRGARAWISTGLGQLVDMQSGGTPSKSMPELWSGLIPWASAKDLKHPALTDTEDHISSLAIDGGAKLAPPGTLFILVRGMTLLKDVPVCVLSRPMAFNQDIKALRPKSGMDGLFLAFQLLARKASLLALVDVAGHGTGKLDTDELRTFTLLIPRLEEQQRIAACLSSLDDLITAASDQLAALKQHKQGLLQQLFPTLDEAAA